MPLLLEYWKPVVGWEDFHEVSNCGAVCHKDTKKRLNPYVSQRYLAVSLRKNPVVKGSKCKRLHILVALAFHGKRPEGMEINHKDAFKGNNRVSNLEYLTPEENREHAKVLGKWKKKGTVATPRKLNEDAVRKIKAMYRRGNSRWLADQFGVSKNCITDIMRGTTWSYVI